MSKRTNNARRDVLANDLTEPFDAKTKVVTATPGAGATPPATGTKRKAPPVASTSSTPSKVPKVTRPPPVLDETMTEQDEEDSEQESVHEEEPIMIPVPGPTSGTTRPSFLTLMKDLDCKPHPIRNTVFILISPHDYLPYFTNVYRAIMNKLYPTSAVPDGECTEDQFTRICRYLLKARVDAVFSQTAGRRVDNRTPVPRDFKIAKSVADVINNIGYIVIDQGGLQVCPQPVQQDNDEDRRAGTYGTYQNLSAVNALMRKAEGLGILKLETISPRPEGTAFWLMAAHTINDAIANNAGVAIPVAVFREFTPSDAIFCVMVQNGFNGHIGGYDTVLWTMEPITGIQELRTTYALQA